jgi:molybdopterin-containing oxidoreductase family membrane subunit
VTAVELTSSEAERWTLPEGRSYEAVNRLVTAPMIERGAWSWRGWWMAFVFGLACTLIFVVSMLLAFATGIGIWGVNSTVVWGFLIANYVWWIGIGNAGTLISAMLLLMRQHWRASINRLAEAMTIFAAAIAGLFPIMHLGRPLYFYWLVPYPNVMTVWPQWRSALIWDFWAILSYLLFSIIFWYVGLIPDFATLRDRARSPLAQRFYGALALGWCGSVRQWHVYHRYQIAMAALAVPLVVSLHSVVGLDFAASLMPGWSETIFPPYFVVGAMYSGFAMVVTLAALVRWGFRLHALITPEHFAVMAKILLMASIIMGLSYATEWFMAWYGGDKTDRDLVAYLFTGDYAPLYYAQLFCNVLAPQAFWFSAIRRNVAAALVIAILINIGMWLERILIIWMTLSHDYLPSMWRLFQPTAWDWLTLIGSLGLFATMYLIFARLVPTISMHEVKKEVLGEEMAA